MSGSREDVLRLVTRLSSRSTEYGLGAPEPEGRSDVALHQHRMRIDKWTSMHVSRQCLRMRAIT
jgi:hypothetical protein